MLNVNWKESSFPVEKRNELIEVIPGGKTPKFDRLQDNINGMDIAVDDTRVTNITLKSLNMCSDSYRAMVYYKVQEHFGLDNDGILKVKFSQFHLFRIWFVL